MSFAKFPFTQGKLYGALKAHRFQSGPKEPLFDYKLESLILKTDQKKIVVNLRHSAYTLHQVLRLMYQIKKKNGKIVFIGHSINRFIDKLLRTLASSVNQFYYNFKVGKNDYASIRAELISLQPDLVISISSRDAYPVLKIAHFLGIPTFGLCEIFGEAHQYCSYPLMGTESSYSQVYFLCKLFYRILA